VPEALGALADAVEDPRDDLVRALPRDRRRERAHVDHSPGGGVDHERLGQPLVGDEGAVGPGDDAEREARAPARLDRRHGQQQRMARAADDHTVEQEVVDRAVERERLEARADHVRRRVQLTLGSVVARAVQPHGELVERRIGVFGAQRRELGGQRERETGVRGAAALCQEHEGHHELGHPNTN
jgi:hypothetical protein